MTKLAYILLGAPGSGKGTQADVLWQSRGLPKISTGDMLRAARRAGSELGKRVAAIMDSGGLVPDEVVLELVGDRLKSPDVARGFVLDGFPRTERQADALAEVLKAQGATLANVLMLEVPRELLEERAVLRRSDAKTGQIYHLKYSPPPPGAELVHREDDKPETVRARLDAYDRITAALVPYYRRKGLLTVIDGVGTPAEVSARVLAGLDRGGADG